MKVFKIVFDNPSESYFAGQAVQGKIVIELNKPKKIKAIKVRCIGSAHAHWREATGKTSTGYYAAEQYFTINCTLIGDEPQDRDIVLPEGLNEFPFKIQLPTGIPSSFEGSQGHVRYTLRATITRPWKFSRRRSSFFTVNGFLDLNLFGHHSRPYTFTVRDYVNTYSLLRCLYCRRLRVGFQMTLNKTGYVPGDTVGFQVHVQNRSNHRIAPIVLQLIHIVTYRETRWNREKNETKVVAEHRGPTVPRKCSFVWDSRTDHAAAHGFKIPPIPPTNLGGGSVIISLQYYLTAILKVNTFLEKKITGKVQLIIGTVPYRNLFEELIPTSLLPQRQLDSTMATDTLTVVTVDPAVTLPSLIESLDFNAPPPTYDEAMELYALYGSTVPSPSAPFRESPNTDRDWERLEDDDDDCVVVVDRPFCPRYATYEWDRHKRSHS